MTHYRRTNIQPPYAAYLYDLFDSGPRVPALRGIDRRVSILTERRSFHSLINTDTPHVTIQNIVHNFRYNQTKQGEQHK